MDTVSIEEHAHGASQSFVPIGRRHSARVSVQPYDVRQTLAFSTEHRAPIEESAATQAGVFGPECANRRRELDQGLVNVVPVDPRQL
ncbi:hypothetical protein D3C73_1443860 [compost metagenome]